MRKKKKKRKNRSRKPKILGDRTYVSETVYSSAGQARLEPVRGTLEPLLGSNPIMASIIRQFSAIPTEAPKERRIMDYVRTLALAEFAKDVWVKDVLLTGTEAAYAGTVAHGLIPCGWFAREIRIYDHELEVRAMQPSVAVCY
ncbi:hypothetical protein FRC10_003127 [Ceratobasidium sp. 414]|nr:hypothetical protein FRC10_003127 [Ceratobasidium sp. 414]